MNKSKVFISSFLLFLLFASSMAYAVPYTGADIIKLGNQFSAIGSYCPDAAWNITDNAIWSATGGVYAEYRAWLDVGNWNIGLNVINNGPMNASYTYFQILNSSGADDWFYIPASNVETNYGYTNVGIAAEGDYTIRFSWFNDYCANGVDANIQINSAFFDNTLTEASPVPEPQTLALLGIGLLGIATGCRKKLIK